MDQNKTQSIIKVLFLIPLVGIILSTCVIFYFTSFLETAVDFFLLAIGLSILYFLVNKLPIPEAMKAFIVLYPIFGISIWVAILSIPKSYPVLTTTEEAKHFIETREFYDSDASVSGMNSKSSIKTPFIISFENGYAIINAEKLPYTITPLANGYPHFGGAGFELTICGSQRYAYGGCIKGYLSNGIEENKNIVNYGPSLQIQGDYLSAFFSFITKNGIVEKENSGRVISTTNKNTVSPQTNNVVHDTEETIPYVEKSIVRDTLIESKIQGTWVVALGSFKTEKEASGLIERCKQSGVNVELLSTNSFEKLTKDYFFVCAGKGLAKEEAKKIASEAKAKGFDGYAKDGGQER